ncbi:MAG: hypothetical protein JJE09_07645, partial [Bacteroidia bacterium]|nr:hypothetical protein [Bacteroidia bacterium]
MKTRLFVIALLAFVSHFCWSQDLITYKNGNEAKGRVIEVTSTEVKFKKEDNPDGPVYSMLKSEIFMIQYANGNKEVFTDKPISKVTDSKEKMALPQYDERLKFSGPRIGFTIIGGGIAADKIRDRGKTPFITQFGWQFETRIFTLKDGTSGLFEFVPLIGGMEQGMFLPSFSALFGIRGKKGTEFAFGPNLSLTGAGMVLAVGTSFHSENVYFPINLVVVPSVSRLEDQYDSNSMYSQEPTRTGVRVSLLIGFMTRKR